VERLGDVQRVSFILRLRARREICMKRYGSVIKVRPESLEAYKKYHAAVWPEVLDMIRRCNLRNYSIFLKDDYLFGYFEYHGSDFAADMAMMAADPKTQEWWAIMMPMQQPLDTRSPGEWWANMEEVFHCD
jgi:L-rhamnose mutarotase